VQVTTGLKGNRGDRGDKDGNNGGNRRRHASGNVNSWTREYKWVLKYSSGQQYEEAIKTLNVSLTLNNLSAAKCCRGLWLVMICTKRCHTSSATWSPANSIRRSTVDTYLHRVRFRIEVEMRTEEEKNKN